jgi:doublecortin-like kinase 3
MRNAYDFIPSKPRAITIIKYAYEKPYKTITILLNRRTMQTFEQLLADISEAFGCQKHRTERVSRRVFLSSNNEIHHAC